jgi:hypothetical protein
LFDLVQEFSPPDHVSQYVPNLQRVSVNKIVHVIQLAQHSVEKGAHALR